jgi:large subunit ribosomal protein L9
MKVILRDEVKSLGRIGDVVNVSEGYARNYLIPKKLAVEANTKNLKEFEHNKRVIMEKAARTMNASKATAEKLSALTLTLTAKAGEEDKLFGSITSKDIADAMAAQGFEIDKKKIVLDDPIKRLGQHSVTVKIHPEVTAQVTVLVVAE